MQEGFVPEGAPQTVPDAATGQAVHLFLDRLAGRYDVADAILFGSRARGTHRPDSDADLAVLLRGRPGAFVPAVRAMADIAFDVLLETGVLIEALPIWEEEWAQPDAYPNPHLLNAIAHEGIRV